MRVAREAPTTSAGSLVLQLKADGQDERHHQCDKRPAVGKELKVGRFVLEIDGDGPVFAGMAGGVAHGSSSGQMVIAADDPQWG
jgi:hypothetical protein